MESGFELTPLDCQSSEFPMSITAPYQRSRLFVSSWTFSFLGGSSLVKLTFFPYTTSFRRTTKSCRHSLVPSVILITRNIQG